MSLPVASGLQPIARRCRVCRLLPAAAAAILGFALSAAVSLLVARWEGRVARQEFLSVSQNHLLVLQNGWDEYLGKLAALQAYFIASEHVGRAEFEDFTGRLLRGEPAIQDFTWVPRVTREQRAAHEQQAIRDGIPGYTIKTVPQHGTLVPAPDQDEYLPVYYGTLPKTNRTYGIDLLAQPRIRTRIEHARDHDQLAGVPDWPLHSTTGERGILFSLPVYRRGTINSSVAERRTNFIGMVHGAFRIAAMVEHSIDANTRPRGVDTYLFAADAAPDDAPLHIHWSRLRDLQPPAKARSELLAGQHWTGEIKAGDERWVVVTTPISPGPLVARHDRAWIVLGAGLLLTLLATAYIATSQRHARRLVLANRKVAELAQTDPLTGLANRRFFLARLEAAFAAHQQGGRPFAVLYFDLDHFKDVNDTMGHRIGDLLLCQVAERVRALVGSVDVVARLGGDEFAVLQADIAGIETSLRLAAAITQALSEPYSLAGNEVHASASIGIAQCSTRVTDAETIMIQADLALYRAKEDGRKCIRLHSSDLDRQVHERVSLAEELRASLGRGDFELHYQPQVELASGRIVGMEALLRWNHPTRGMLAPGTFIGIAERTGLILPLGRWAFEEACRQLRLWLDAGVAPATVAVNVSAVQIKHAPELQREIAESLTRWRIPRGAMEMELTESVLMDVTEQHSRLLQQLRQLGLQISIDDFGTGYSSLNYLTLHPINRLKIARELVSRVATDPRCATVVRATIRLAAELGIELLAEGVEDARQASFLARAGCQDVQGYYFSRPVDARAATSLLRAGTIDVAERHHERAS